MALVDTTGTGTSYPIILQSRKAFVSSEPWKKFKASLVSAVRFGATVNLAGSAEAIGETVIRVNWENLTTRTKGYACGTDSWSVAAGPLRGKATHRTD